MLAKKVSMEMNFAFGRDPKRLYSSVSESAYYDD
jgi:hypothetical protein